jgi:hypothetical protein
MFDVAMLPVDEINEDDVFVFRQLSPDWLDDFTEYLT